MKVLCLTPTDHIAGLNEILESCGEVYYHPNALLEDVIRLVNEINPHALFVNPNKMHYMLDESVLLPCVKVISTASTGTNHIDLDYCESKGIEVLSLTTDYDVITKITSTAEMALALTLSLIRNIPSAFEAAKKYEWDYQPYIGRQLDHLRVGVIGYGRLGKMYAHYCKALGMHVVVYDPYKRDEIKADGYDGYSGTMTLQWVFENCNIISLHIHLNDETKGIINDPLLSKTKDKGSYLINTSRGEVVVEKDIIKAMEDGKLAGYATDVVSDELTDVADSPIIAASNRLNIIVTPHIGGMTKEAQEIAYGAAARKLKQYFDKDPKQ